MKLKQYFFLNNIKTNDIFYWILFISLLFVALRIYAWNNITLNLNLDTSSILLVSLITGSILGFIAGTVGIGGSIYLDPLIIILGLGTQKQAAATGIIFIWLNSLAGLVSRLQHNAIELTPHIALIIAVVIGGFSGSLVGATRFSAKLMEKILGAIILFALFTPAKKLIGLYF